MLPWPAYRRTILPALTGPMRATPFSGTRIFPLAGIIPAMDCVVTITVSIVPLCVATGFEVLFWAAVRLVGALRLHPPAIVTTRSIAIKRAWDFLVES